MTMVVVPMEYRTQIELFLQQNQFSTPADYSILHYGDLEHFTIEFDNPRCFELFDFYYGRRIKISQ